MGEAILVKTLTAEGGGSGSGGASQGVISMNGIYTCTVSGNYRVTCVGGGQGGSSGILNTTTNDETGYEKLESVTSYGGNSGAFKSTNLSLTANTTYPVIVGAGGGANSQNGGISSFGSLASSSGGSYARNSGSTGGKLYFSPNASVSTTSATGYTELPYGVGGTGGGAEGSYHGWYSTAGDPGVGGCIIIAYLD